MLVRLVLVCLGPVLFGDSSVGGLFLVVLLDVLVLWCFWLPDVSFIVEVNSIAKLRMPSQSLFFDGAGS